MDALTGLRAAMAEVDASYKERGIFQGKFGFGQSPALVVIDMAYGWTDAAYAGGSARLDAAVAAIHQLLSAARSKKVPIFYTTAPFRDAPQIKSAADYSPNFRKWDRRACAIDERLQPLPSELVIEKEHASAFAGTALVGSHAEVADRIQEYHELGIDHFILSGQPHLEEAYYFAEGAATELRKRGLLPAEPARQGS